VDDPGVWTMGAAMRRIRAGFAALACALALLEPAQADPRRQVIGNWFVTSDADRFGDGVTVVALNVQDANSIALRCLQGELSLAMLGKYAQGDLFQVKFRVDRWDVIDTVGFAISDSVLQIMTSPQMVRQMMSGSEYALRVTGTTSTRDYVFRAGAAARALVPVVKACPLERK